MGREAASLPPDWAQRQTRTQALGNRWLDSAQEVLLFVPSVVTGDLPDHNVLINHRAAGADAITIAEITPFSLDPRLFKP